MSTTVVQAHPLDESLSVALLDAAVAGLRSTGIEPTVLRLSRGDNLTAAAVENAQHLVVIYPTWWGSTPAMLLGPLVDLVGPWIDGEADALPSPLRSIERLTVVTSHGSSQLINRLQGEPGRQLWQRTILGLCADGAAFDWVSLYKLDRLDDAARAGFIEHVADRLAS